MKKHFKNLFLNLPIRHEFIHIEDDTDNSTETLKNLINVKKITNYFILTT